MKYLVAICLLFALASTARVQRPHQVSAAQMKGADIYELTHQVQGFTQHIADEAALFHEETANELVELLHSPEAQHANNLAQELISYGVPGIQEGVDHFNNEIHNGLNELWETALILREVTTRHGFEAFTYLIEGEKHHGDGHYDDGHHVEYHHGDVHVEGNVEIDGDLYVHGHIHEEKWGEYHDDHWEDKDPKDEYDDDKHGKGYLIDEALFEIDDAKHSLDHATGLLHEKLDRRDDHYPAFLAVNKPNKALTQLVQMKQDEEFEQYIHDKLLELEEAGWQVINALGEFEQRVHEHGNELAKQGLEAFHDFEHVVEELLNELDYDKDEQYIIDEAHFQAQVFYYIQGVLDWIAHDCDHHIHHEKEEYEQDIYGHGGYGYGHGGDDFYGDDSYGDFYGTDDFYGEDSYGDFYGTDDFYGDDSYGDFYGTDDFYGDDSYGDFNGIDDFYGDDSYGDFYGTDDFYGDDLYGDDFYGDDIYGDDFYGDDLYGDDFYGDETYGDVDEFGAYGDDGFTGFLSTESDSMYGRGSGGGY